MGYNDWIWDVGYSVMLVSCLGIGEGIGTITGVHLEISMNFGWGDVCDGMVNTGNVSDPLWSARYGVVQFGGVSDRKWSESVVVLDDFGDC